MSDHREAVRSSVQGSRRGHWSALSAPACAGCGGGPARGRRSHRRWPAWLRRGRCRCRCASGPRPAAPRQPVARTPGTCLLEGDKGQAQLEGRASRRRRGAGAACLHRRSPPPLARHSALTVLHGIPSWELACSGLQARGLHPVAGRRRVGRRGLGPLRRPCHSLGDSMKSRWQSVYLAEARHGRRAAARRPPLTTGGKMQPSLPHLAGNYVDIRRDACCVAPHSCWRGWDGQHSRYKQQRTA